jgi:Transglycosylase-like domain
MRDRFARALFGASAFTFCTFSIAALASPLLSGGPAVAGTTITTSYQSYVPPHPRYPVPAAAIPRTRWTVQAGQTLSGIASVVYGNPGAWYYLARANGISGTIIIPGERLKLPPRRSSYPAPPPPPPLKETASTTVQDAVSQGPPVNVSGSAFEECVIQAESGGDPAAYNPSSGASGLFGFLLSTWDALGLGYPGGAYTAPVSVQEAGFWKEYDEVGTSAWAPYDGCS